MTTGHRIHIKGFRLDKKTGKPVRSVAHLDISHRLQKAASKKIRVKGGGK